VKAQGKCLSSRDEHLTKKKKKGIEIRLGERVPENSGTNVAKGTGGRGRRK